MADERTSLLSRRRSVREPGEDHAPMDSKDSGWLKRTLPTLGWPPVLLLENRSSVARDHLASERTYLAWLRTSLSLTSIGVAVTQLFRLTSALYSEPASSQASALPPNLGSGGSDAAPLTADQLQELVLLLYAQVQDQAKLIDELGTGVDNGRTAYRHLGKPIGVAFIALGLSFLFIGHYRYFRVQHVLQTNKYPPSRSAIVFGTLSVGIIIIASFASILVVRPPGSA